MVDNLRLPQSNTVLFSSGTPVNGGRVEIFDAGTNNQKDVFTDAALTVPAANPIVANSAGVVPVRYIGTGAYKAVYQDSLGGNLADYTTEDNVPGALDTSGFLTGTVSPSRATRSITTTTTLTDTDDGLHVNADPSGGDFTVTLRSAVTMGDGGDVLIKNSGTSGAVTVDTTGGQTIDGEPRRTLYVGDAAVFRSDGSNYLVGEGYRFTNGIVTVLFSATLDIDVSLYPSGVDYQITATDDFTLTTSNDRAGLGYSITIIQDATGNRIPTFNSKFNGNVNIDLRADAVSNIGVFTRTTSALDFWLLNPIVTGVPDVIVENQQVQNTAGGSTTVDGSFQDTPLNTLVRNVDTIASLSSDQVTLPAGTYYAEWSVPFALTGLVQCVLYDRTTDTIIKGS